MAVAKSVGSGCGASGVRPVASKGGRGASHGQPSGKGRTSTGGESDARSPSERQADVAAARSVAAVRKTERGDRLASGFNGSYRGVDCGTLRSATRDLGSRLWTALRKPGETGGRAAGVVLAFHAYFNDVIQTMDGIMQRRAVPPSVRSQARGPDEGRDSVGASGRPSVGEARGQSRVAPGHEEGSVSRPVARGGRRYAESAPRSGPVSAGASPEVRQRAAIVARAVLEGRGAPLPARPAAGGQETRLSSGSSIRSRVVEHKSIVAVPPGESVESGAESPAVRPPAAVPVPAPSTSRVADVRAR